MKTIAFDVPDDKDLNTLLEVIKKFGYNPQVEISVIQKPFVQLKKAIEEVEKGKIIKCSTVDEMMKKLRE
jgi:hypothetical protein